MNVLTNYWTTQQKRIVISFVLLILVSTLIYAASFDTVNQTDFDTGTYANTYYDNSTTSVHLNTSTNGSYTSIIFDANGSAEWHSISWTAAQATQSILYTVDGNGIVYHSGNSGFNWSAVNDSYGGGGSTEDMFTDQTNLYILFSGTSRKEIWRSTDQGTSWVLVNETFTSNNLKVADADHNNKLYVVNGQGTVWQSIDQGVTWISQGDFNGGATDNAKGIAINSTNAIYLSDSNGAIFVSTDEGANWTEQTSDYGDGNSDDMAIASTDDLYLARNKDIWRSTDDGLNWTLINDSFTDYTQNALTMVIDGNDSFYIIDDAQRVFQSLDYGFTWTEIEDDFNDGTGSDTRGLTFITYESNLSAYARACTDSNCSNETWQGPYINSTTLLNFSNMSYFQYLFNFTAGIINVTPHLYNVSVNYSLLSSNDSNSPPNITANSPDNNSNLTSNNVTLNVTVYDIDLDNLTVYFYGDEQLLNTSYNHSNASNVTYYWINLSDGAHNWTSIVYDGEHNVSLPPHYFTINNSNQSGNESEDNGGNGGGGGSGGGGSGGGSGGSSGNSGGNSNSNGNAASSSSSSSKKSSGTAASAKSSSGGALFDVKLLVQERYKEVYAGQQLLVTLDLTNFGDDVIVPVDLTYTIFDSKEQTITRLEKQLAVDTQTEVIETFTLAQTLEPGVYQVHVRMDYGDEQYAISEDTFTILEKPTVWAVIPGVIKFILLSLLFLALAFLIFTLIKQRKLTWVGPAIHKFASLFHRKKKHIVPEPQTLQQMGFKTKQIKPLAQETLNNPPLQKEETVAKSNVLKRLEKIQQSDNKAPVTPAITAKPKTTKKVQYNELMKDFNHTKLYKTLRQEETQQELKKYGLMPEKTTKPVQDLNAQDITVTKNKEKLLKQLKEVYE